MTVTTINERKSDRGWRPTALIVLRVVLALAFAASALFKLSGKPAVIDEFARVGLGQWFRYVTAALELMGAGLLLWPRTVAFGAIILGTICVGAFFAQIFRLHLDVIHTIVIGGLCALLVWAYRGQLNRGV